MISQTSGVSQNYAEAVKWYSKAAEQGDADAQYNLGWCYYYGYGISLNRASGIEWWRKAARQGIARAQNALKINGETW